jgi:hypothetical protein
VLGLGGVGDCKPRERLELLGDLDGVAMLGVGAQHCVDRSGELGSAFPGREQVDVFARPVKDAVDLYGYPPARANPYCPATCSPISASRR